MRHQVTRLRAPSGATVVQVAQVEEAPLSEEQAAPLIEQFLSGKQRLEVAAAEVKRLREAAKLANAPPAPAPVATPAPAPAPAQQAAAETDTAGSYTIAAGGGYAACSDCPHSSCNPHSRFSPKKRVSSSSIPGSSRRVLCTSPIDT